MPGFSFSTACRLKKPAEYQRVFANAVKSCDAYFTLLATVTETEQARLGLAISKKAVRRAVGRNRLKRAVRESFRQEQASLSHLDIVVLARKEAADAPPMALRESLRKHWHKLRKRCKPS